MLARYDEEDEDIGGDDGPSRTEIIRTEDKAVAALNELASIEAFATFLMDEERTSFTFVEAEELAEALGLSVATPVIRGLKEYGFKMEERGTARRVRGCRTSSNDRYFGPGAERMHGGTGYENITGFAGQEG